MRRFALACAVGGLCCLALPVQAQTFSYFDLEEGSGTAVTGVGMFDTNGTVQNPTGPDWVAGAPGGFSPRTGRYMYAQQLNGKWNRVELFSSHWTPHNYDEATAVAEASTNDGTPGGIPGHLATPRSAVENWRIASVRQSKNMWIGLDVDPFVAAVVGGGAAAVPEPSTLLLALIALAVVGRWLAKKQQSVLAAHMHSTGRH